MATHVDSTALDALRARLQEVHDLRVAAAVLEWDHLVLMPSAGSAVRAERIATLRRVAHERFVDPTLGELLDGLADVEASLDPASDDASLIRVARRDWTRATRVPADLESRLAQAAAAGHDAWAAAREASDFPRFRPVLEHLLELRREYAACVAEPGQTPYDALLQDYEEGSTTAEIAAVFDRLKPELIAFAHAAEPGLEPFITATYPREAQHAVSLRLMAAMGCAPESFRLDGTVHPFCTSFAIDDIRLTTRYPEHDLHGNSVFSTLHEAGHGLYEHGISRALERTPLADGCSSALHESQSRLWENVVGRSLPFLRWFYPDLQAAFPEALGDVSLAAYHRAVNRPRQGFIRVDADEMTYGLHIILRFELEQDLLSGALPVADLPEAWNAKVREYLGLEVPNDRMGCLQDVHWSSGDLGYFPTYQLGNVLSVQIWERLRRDVPDVDDRLERGELGVVDAWLREHLYVHGRKFTPKETVELAAGGPIDPEPYLRYLHAKVDSLT